MENRVEKLRKELGMNQEELAKAIRPHDFPCQFMWEYCIY